MLHESKVFGEGVHPEETSICRSAILDRAVPFSGGLLGMGVAQGLK